jgi:hypothetical protein
VSAAAELARKEFTEAEDAKRALEKKIQKLEDWVRNDYGESCSFQSPPS